MREYIYKYLICCNANRHIYIRKDACAYLCILRYTSNTIHAKIFNTRIHARLFLCRFLKDYHIYAEEYKKRHPSLIPIPHYETLQKGFTIIRWKETPFYELWVEGLRDIKPHIYTTVSGATTL